MGQEDERNSTQRGDAEVAVTGLSLVVLLFTQIASRAGQSPPSVPVVDGFGLCS